MHFSTLFAAAAVVGAAVAEKHVIGVGNKDGDLVFVPDSVRAAEGDTVEFKFWPKNHSVAQSTFANPCTASNGGFWSGYISTTSVEAAANWTFNYEITNASAPIWFYCTQGQHCRNGMVGVINPPQSGPNTLAAFKQSASRSTNKTEPASAAGFGGELVEGGNSTSPTPSGSGAPAENTGAASQLAGSAAFAGLTSFFAYLLI